VEPWVQAGKYVAAVASDLPRRNGWTIAQRVGDRAPQRTQRLLNRAVWDPFAAMGVVRRFAVAGLDEAARRSGRPRGMRVGAIDETSQVKQGRATAGVKRHYLGCAGKVANGITTVHLSYVRERTGHALIGARQWIPAEHIDDPATSLAMGLPGDLEFRTKGQLAIGILTEALAAGDDSPDGLGQPDVLSLVATPAVERASRPVDRPGFQRKEFPAAAGGPGLGGVREPGPDATPLQARRDRKLPGIGVHLAGEMRAPHCRNNLDSRLVPPSDGRPPVS
jgi:hypothetical protein